MGDREDRKKRLKEKSKESRKKTDMLLADELQALVDSTSTDLEKLRPKVTDKETYDILIAAVKESINRNESVAQLKSRLEKLGSTAINVGKEAVELLKGL